MSTCETLILTYAVVATGEVFFQSVLKGHDDTARPERRAATTSTELTSAVSDLCPAPGVCHGACPLAAWLKRFWPRDGYAQAFCLDIFDQLLHACTYCPVLTN
jgi:hypothetical protein